MEERRVTAAEALVQVLRREGIDTAFGIASGYLSVFLDALRRGGIKSIINLHEAASGFAAAGYTLASGKLGVLYTQSGPGTTNAVTPVAAAYMDSVPQMLIATQAPLALYGRDAHQEVSGGVHGIEQLDMFTSAASVRYRPTTGDTLIRSTRRAIAASYGNRSTSVVEVGGDLWSKPVAHEDLAPAEYRAISSPIDTAALGQVLEMLGQAKRPVLLVGHRAVHRGTSAELVAFCEKNDLPVATVDFTKGAIPEDHPLSLGILGSCGHDSATTYFQQSDLVIALGTRMATQTTFDFDASLFKNLVHIDEIAEEPGRNLRLKLGVISDLPGAIRWLASSSTQVQRGSAERVRALRVEHHVYETPKDRPSTSTPAMLAAIREVMPRETLVTGDSGLTLQYLKHFFPVYSADGFFSLYSFAAMGSGLPLSIGVSLARQDVPTLCVIGDGGALVHLSELAAAAFYNLPLVIVIVNNNGYKQVGDRMEHYQHESVGCELPKVDFAAVATACGCDSYVATDAPAAAAAVRTALEKRRTSVIELRVKGDNLFDITPPRIKQWWDSLLDNKIDPNHWPFEK
ncbi:MAG TPA: thiamine pyrophosphate-binding protein [Kofleriaceae bacterium]|jgi:acetolactate synthase-1/2/3 large subunit